MNEEPELVEDEEESDDLAVEGLSFFSGSSALDLPLNDPAWDVFERADRAVTDRIWRIYQRQSGAERAPLERLPARDVPAPCPPAPPVITTDDTETMGETMTAQPKKRGEMLEQTLAAYKKVEARIGAKPSALEVYAELGEAGKSLENVRMAVKRLDQKGLLGQVRPQPTAKPIVKTTPTPRRKDGKAIGVALEQKPRVKPASARTSPPPDAGTGDDHVLAALIAKRDALADKVAALTSAIEAWQS